MLDEETQNPPGRDADTAALPSPAPRPPAGETIAAPVAVGLIGGDDGEAGGASDVFAGPVPRDGVPGYELIREISRGGQAVVYLATQKSTGKRVAVKVMREGPFATARERARFDREVQILAALEHPGIVAVLDRGSTAAGFYYIVMQFVAGRRLDHYLSDLRVKRTGGGEPPDPSKLLKLFMRICDAVNAAHLRGIVHRDLKPSNIIVGDDGEPRVLDFGLARVGFGVVEVPSNSDGGSSSDGEAPPARPEPLTITGQFIGSLPWASPEQAEGAASKIDTRSDVYSLGVVLYQMLTDTFPYEVAGTMRDVLNNILTVQPTPPSLVLEARRRTAAEVRQLDKARRVRIGGAGGGGRDHRVINEAIEAIVLKALSKRREERYQTAGEFGRDVANYLSGRPTIAAGDRPARGGGAMSRGRMLLIGAAAVVVLGAAAVTGVLVARYTDSGPSTIVAPGANDAPTRVVQQTPVAGATATAPAVMPAAIPPGVPVDLFVAVDLERDCEGELWQRLPTGLARDETSVARSALLPPIAIDGDYELGVHFQAHGRANPMIALPVGDGYVVAHLQAWDKGRQEFVVGIEAEHPDPTRTANLTAVSSPLTDRGTHVATFRVQLAGNGEATVHATLDDRPVLNWRGTGRVSPASDHRPKPPGRIGFIGLPDNVTAYAMGRFNLLRGTAQWLHKSPAKTWPLGARVLAQRGPEPYSYIGTVKEARSGDREYLVEFDDFATQWTDASRLCADDIRADDMVLANWRRKGIYFHGAISKREQDRIHIQYYDDGSSEETTVGMLRVVRPRPVK